MRLETMSAHVDGVYVGDVEMLTATIRLEDGIMTKYYAEGDKVRYVSGPWFNIGDILTVLDDDGGRHMPLLCRDNEGIELNIDRSEVERVESGPNARLTEAEAMIKALHARNATLELRIMAIEIPDLQRVTSLEGEIETLKCQMYSVEKNYGRAIAELESRVISITDALIDSEKRAVKPVLADDQYFKRINDMYDTLSYMPAEALTETPNQRRADVIKRAQAFVADLHKPHWDESGDKVVGRGGFLYTTEFIVNVEKRTVVALTRYYGRTYVVNKAFAKCDPDDVFNADIGKAIAAGRLYGVDIPREFLKAPMPTEVVVGMRVRGGNGYGQYDSSRIFTLYKTREDGWAYREDYKDSAGDWITEDDIGLITEDTDAIYS